LAADLAAPVAALRTEDLGFEAVFGLAFAFALDLDLDFGFVVLIAGDLACSIESFARTYARSHR
jgi:hypothetical protein